MLAVFAKEVAPFPELDNSSMNLYTADSVSAMEYALAKHYTYLIPNSFMIDLQPWCMLATTLDQKNSIIPQLCQVKDDIFCLMSGSIENINELAVPFHFNKDTDQLTIVSEAYRSQRRVHDGPESKLSKDQREFYWLSFVKALKGKFTILLFDNLKKTLFATTDRDAHLPFFWGIDVKGDLVLTIDSEMAKLGCQRAYGCFPRGCYISTADGLKSLDDQNKVLYVEEDVDSVGNSYMKVIFDVDSNSTGGYGLEGSTESTAGS